MANVTPLGCILLLSIFSFLLFSKYLDSYSMHVALIQVIVLFTGFASKGSCNNVSSIAVEPPIMDLFLIKLPEEVKKEIPVPSIMDSWEETEFALFSDAAIPFEYALNMSHLDIAKLHLLNSNSGKFRGNDYSGHQASYKGNLTELTLDDMVYLYYNEDRELVLDSSIPFYTNDETKTDHEECSPTTESNAKSNFN